jgi:hypothetical protein
MLILGPAKQVQLGPTAQVPHQVVQVQQVRVLVQGVRAVLVVRGHTKKLGITLKAKTITILMLFCTPRQAQQERPGVPGQMVRQVHMELPEQMVWVQQEAPVQPLAQPPELEEQVGQRVLEVG